MTIPLRAPGRPTRRSGVLLTLVLFAGGAAACDALGGGATIQLDSTEVDLPGADLHEVMVTGAGAVDSIAPEQVRVSTGDAVRFEVGDHRTHALTFDTPELQPAIREYLERTGQLRGPPLVNEGAAWVVVLREAPAGRYPFYCRAHDATGVVVVEAEG